MAVRDNNMYINVYDHKDLDYPFQFFVGGRGTGKTYSMIGGAVEGEVENRFMYSRITDKEYQILLDKKGVEGANPFKRYNKDNNTNYGLVKINNALAGIYDREQTAEGLLLPKGQPIGYGAALYNIADLRSLDFFDVTDWLIDEFILEKHKHGLKDLAEAFFNAYETINRNRELEAEPKPPVNVFACANSNNIYNDMFKGLGIVADVERMVRKKQTDKYYKDRKMAIHLLKNSPIFEEKKRQTALYCLTRGTAYAEMALNNKFVYDDFSLVGYKRLVDYAPVVNIVKGDLEYSIYRRKGTKDMHVTYYKAKYVETFDVSKAQEKANLKKELGNMLYAKFLKGYLTFETYELKAELLDILTVKI